MGPDEILKAVPAKVVEEAYSDAVKDTLREASKIGVDAVKTFRLALFPLQFTSAFQDRLAAYIDRAIRKVPAANRIAPMESLALPIAEKLRFQEEDNIITEMYVNLLARAMDRERVGEAHPAFIHIVSQIAPDEVLLIEHLANHSICAFARKGKNGHVTAQMARNGLTEFRAPSALFDGLVNQINLAQPELLYTYIEHVVSLGIVSYTNEKWEMLGWSQPRARGKIDFGCIELNEFGGLFHRACARQIN